MYVGPMCVCVCIPLATRGSKGILIKFGMNNTKASGSNIGYVSMTLTPSNRPDHINQAVYIGLYESVGRMNEMLCHEIQNL